MSRREKGSYGVLDTPVLAYAKRVHNASAGVLVALAERDNYTYLPAEMKVAELMLETDLGQRAVEKCLLQLKAAGLATRGENGWAYSGANCRANRLTNECANNRSLPEGEKSEQDAVSAPLKELEGIGRNKDIPSGANPPAPSTEPAAPHEEKQQPLVPSQPAAGQGGGEENSTSGAGQARAGKSARESRHKKTSPAAPRPRNAHFDALALALYGRADQLANASHIARVAKLLAGAAWTPEDVTYVVGRAAADPFWRSKISPGAVEKHAEDWRRRYGPARPVVRQAAPPADDLSFNAFLFPQQVNG